MGGDDGTNLKHLASIGPALPVEGYLHLQPTPQT